MYSTETNKSKLEVALCVGTREGGGSSPSVQQ